MNRQQLVDAVGERLGDRRTAAVAVEAVLDTVTAALASGERVALFGFGVFEKVDRAARTARNPATGGTVQVPATAVPRFRAGQALKDAVSGRPSATRTSAREVPDTAVAIAGDATSTKPSSAKDAKDAKPKTGKTKKKSKKRTSKADGKPKAKADKDKRSGKQGR